MKPLIQVKTTIPPVRKPVNPVSAGFLIPLVLVCFGLAPTVQAVGPDTAGAIAGSNNGEGIGVLVSRTTGVWNTGTGFQALNQLTGGNQNTATGLRALNSDTNGGFNTATGVYSLFSNTSGFFNSATGAYALANNTDGTQNTANGYAALYFNTADANTATGFAALYKNTIGGNNTANGVGALGINTTGTSNTAYGFAALANNTIGGFNIALGTGAGGNLSTGNFNIDIGNVGVAGESETIRIGGSQTRTFIAGINGVTVGLTGIPVVIDSAGQLGTIVSSKRFKREIQPMDKASEAILSLKPVTFHYKSDTKDTPQFGLIAEEVAQVNPDLVVRDSDGEIYTVRYDAVNAMLLNEFLKEHRKVEEQEVTIAQQRKDFEATISELKKEMDTVVARLKEHDSKIQRVSDQIEVSKPASQVVLNNP